MRELRQGLAEVVGRVQSGEQVLAGSHRKPEVAIMSIEQYERLTAAGERAVRNAVASAEMEGLFGTPAEDQALGEFAAGTITREQYRHRLLPEYFPEA